MPARNVIKQYAPDSYYHIYFRGLNKQPIFLSDDDKSYFLHLLERYLSNEPAVSKTGVPYPHLAKSLDLNAFCLMDNHVHLLIFQRDIDAMSKLMKSLLGSYTRYFNLKYKRSGPIFETTYKASLIDSDTYMVHITRYIHMNPRRWRRYKYSSLRYYLGYPAPQWLMAKTPTNFASPDEYLSFLHDYEENKQELEEIRHQLANF